MGWFGKKMNAYKGSKRDGPWELYYQDGALSWKGNFRAGPLHGPWAAYYENGQLQQTGTYSGGELDGPYETYDENGQLRFKGTRLQLSSTVLRVLGCGCEWGRAESEHGDHTVFGMWR